MTGRSRPARTSALPLRSRNNNISYREQSLGYEDEVEQSEPSPIHRPRRSSRKRRRRVDDEDFSESPNDAQVLDGVDSPVVPNHISHQLAKRKSSSSRASRDMNPRQGAGSSGPNKSLGIKRAIDTSKRDEKNADGEACDFGVSRLGGRVPPWQTLPYEILLQIFQYAWYPLVNEDFYPDPIITSGWLLKTALLCKGFAEPALAALYYTPPLSPPSRAHKFLNSLDVQHANSYVNYRGMVKHLNIEAREILCRKYQGRKPITLGRLLCLTPQARTVGLHLTSDPPARRKGTYFQYKALGKLWSYQPDLFHALFINQVRLHDWTWNVKLAQQLRCPDMLYDDYHTWKSFQTLKSLTLVNAYDPIDTEKFTRSTSVLPHLTTITFQNAQIEDSQILETLPKTLKVIKFINCPLLDSLNLAEFLKTHGSDLRELVLDHNNSLDLFFLQQLRASCPKLEKIKMDLRFYNTHFTYNDSEPKFDALLSDGCIPYWPETLQRVEFFHLRKWDTTAAKTFFRSLTGSAARLPDLRYIDIKASLAESNWRDRITFRNKWISMMEKVFQRVSAPPDPRLRSLATFEEHREEYRVPSRLAGVDATVDGLALRKGTDEFSQVQVTSPSAGCSSGSSDEPLASKRRSTRLTTRSDDQLATRPRARKRRKRKRKIDEDSSSEEDSALEDTGTNENSPNSLGDDDTDIFIQGMCDVVRVVIDNLRPMEEHLDESAFLDDEISGDEDWNGDDELGGGASAW